MLHIIHVNHRYFPALGGSETHFKEISERLAKKGHKVVVVTTDLIDLSGIIKHKPFYEVVNGVEVYRVFFSSVLKRVVTNRIRMITERLNKPLLWGLFRDSIGLLVFMKILTLQRPDIVHTGGIPSSCIAGTLFASKIRNIPCIVTPFYPVGNKGIAKYDRYWSAVLNFFDRVIVPTKAEKCYLTKNGVENEKTKVIGTGIDFFGISKAGSLRKQSKYQEFKALFLCTRMLEKDKGIYLVIDAARKLQDIKFIFAGVSFETWVKIKQKVPVPSNCKFLGVLSEREKVDILNETDIFVMPSIVESFGICYMEALSAGKPIVVARSPVTEELYKNVGETVEFGDALGLVNAIKKLKDNKRLYTQYSQRGKELAKRYNWDKIVSQIENVYFELVESYHRKKKG